jgi:hypothetical protein
LKESGDFLSQVRQINVFDQMNRPHFPIPVIFLPRCCVDTGSSPFADATLISRKEGGDIF